MVIFFLFNLEEYSLNAWKTREHISAGKQDGRSEVNVTIALAQKSITLGFKHKICSEKDKHCVLSTISGL